MFTMTKQCKN